MTHRSVQIASLVVQDEHHGNYRRILLEMQNVRSHHEWRKNHHGQRPYAVSWTLLPERVHWQNFQDHCMMTIRADRIRLIETEGGEIT